LHSCHLRRAQSPHADPRIGKNRTRSDVDALHHPDGPSDDAGPARTAREVKDEMATDYDAPRKTDDELAEDSLEELKAQRANKAASAVDVDEVELAENLELPGADLSDESLTVRVLPRQADEFTCSRCFLVHHRSQLAKEVNGEPVCRDCA
jgi:hypothetical protein